MHLHGTLIAAVAGAALAAGAAQAAAPLDPVGLMTDAGTMQTGRYTTARAVPAKLAAQPLDAQVRITYPLQNVRTVGEAIRYTLERTGWRFPAPAALQPQAAHLLTLPLPESQRTLGPYTVATVLQVLTGDSWRWHRDPVQRVTWFDLVPQEPAAQQAQQTTAAAEAAVPGAVASPVRASEVTPAATAQTHLAESATALRPAAGESSSPTPHAPWVN